MRLRSVGCAVIALVSITAVAPTTASASAADPQIIRTDAGGHHCSAGQPVRDTSSTELSAFVVDPSAQSNSSVTYTFELWPSADPTEVTSKTETSFLGYLGRDRVPDTELSDGTQYSFRAQAQTTTGVSPSTVECAFRYDATAPSTPTLSSANYPQETWGPPGEPVQFTFDGNGDPDVAGFYYSWGTPPLYACDYSGPHGEEVCPGVFAQPGSIRANGAHSASLTVNPPGDGLQRMTVRALDRAGNPSPPVTYQVYVTPTYPTVTTVGPTNCDGGPTTLRFTPHENVGTVVSWNYQIVFGGPITSVPAEPDGTAQVTVTTVANSRMQAQSVSANGFTSSWGYPAAYFKPSVNGTPYAARTSAGGPGQPGSFSLQAPFGTPVAAIRYLFVGGSPVVLPADPSTGGATFDWTPQAAGRQRLLVRAQTPDGHWSCATSYRFRVAGG